MPDYEALLLSRAAQGQCVDELIQKGVDANLFLDEAHRALWSWMAEHYTRYNTPPSLQACSEAAAELAPDLRWEMATDATDYLVDRFFAAAKRRHSMRLLRALSEVMDDEDEVDRIDEHFMVAARELVTLIPSTNVVRYSDAQARIDRYHAQRFAPNSVTLLPYGIPFLDDYTLGIQQHELVIISGWSGTGKSTLLFYILWSIYMAGFTPMLYSLEMESTAVQRKFDTLASNISYTALKKLDLPRGQMEKWERAAERAANAKNDILVFDDVGKITVERVYGDIVKYRPDVVGIDYMTLMTPPRRSNNQSMWEGVTMISNDLKATALGLKTPIISVAQTNAGQEEAGFGGSKIAYSKSIIRDADIMVGLFQDDDMRRLNKMRLDLKKNRDGRMGSVELFWDVDRMVIEPWRNALAFPDPQESSE